ncbi:protein of unknown function [Maridesulfovibrio hydrothermalis AM13 = DSM 14728]|uniref:Uncharacterized protein n=1 Tax=Maridesulfovibrio hydrothermalis AM13 = DSM 14728 TaxID=1121451 RepID=L0RBK7_9BACT|nr:protein of unknown function [Maridesulfovibrio hydrothermalis AM13 = DSM 14728]
MPLTDTLTPFAEYGMHPFIKGCKSQNGEYADRANILCKDEFYFIEVCLVAITDGGLRGS